MRYTAEQVVEALENVEADVYERYSGRCMYGAECPGFEASSDARAFSVFVRLAELDAGMAEALAGSAKTDSMGLGVIVYWPDITYAKAAEEKN